MTPDTYATLSAVALAAGVRSGAFRPTEIAEAALARLARIDPLYHAFTFVNAAGARADAASLERRAAAGEALGPLAGVPVAVKDLILTRDMPTSFGSRLYEGFCDGRDDIVVERLRAADAILIGKTNCSEFGYGGFGHNPLFPTTRNPWNPELTPGGSSAGSAVAVLTGVCPIALGSDGGGSIRLPAAFTGIIGIKASMGRVPLWPGCRDATLPGVSSWESIEHVGPLARSVEDAALMLSVIAGPDPRDSRSIPCADVDWCESAAAQVPNGLRVAWCVSWADQPVDGEVARICEAHARRLCAAVGADLIEADAPSVPVSLFREIVARDTDMEGLAALRAGRKVSVGLAELLDRPPTRGGIGIARMAAVAEMAGFMSAFDLVLSPAAACLPFGIDRDGPGTIDGRAVADDAWTPAAYPMNLTGQPAASVPAGQSASGLPVGLQIAAGHLADDLVLSVSAASTRLMPNRSFAAART